MRYRDTHSKSQARGELNLARSIDAVAVRVGHGAVGGVELQIRCGAGGLCRAALSERRGAGRVAQCVHAGDVDVIRHIEDLGHHFE